jgi:hypothetical protein
MLIGRHTIDTHNESSLACVTPRAPEGSKVLSFDGVALEHAVLMGLSSSLEVESLTFTTGGAIQGSLNVLNASGGKDVLTGSCQPNGRVQFSQQAAGNRAGQYPGWQHEGCLEVSGRVARVVGYRRRAPDGGGDDEVKQWFMLVMTAAEGQQPPTPVTRPARAPFRARLLADKPASLRPVVGAVCCLP